MSKLLTVILVSLTVMVVANCGKTPHETIIGKYEFVKNLTLEMPEYKYIDIDEDSEDFQIMVDSELEITEDSISWKIYDKDYMTGNYTLKYENKEKGEVELISKTKESGESIVSIEILDDQHIKFRQAKGVPPLVFKRVLEFVDSPEKAKRKKEYELNLANVAARADLQNMFNSIYAYLSDHNVASIDLMAVKKETGLVLSEGVSIEILNNQLDSLILVSTHKSGDTEYIMDSSGEITQQKILSENEILSIVKNGVFPKYPGITVNQAVNDFLGSPSWEVIRANNGRYYVNVAGKFVLNKKPAKAILQLKVDTNDETSTVNVLEINGESQNYLERKPFLDAMFSGN